MWKALCVVAVDGLSQIWTSRTLIGALNAFVTVSGQRVCRWTTRITGHEMDQIQFEVR